jgi:lysozyme
MEYDKEKLVDQLIKHEGMELKVYKDSLGIETIGIGRNLVDRGVTEEEARYLCNNDIEIVERELVASFPFVAGLDDCRLRVLLDMAFNIGIPRLRGFAKMWAAVEEGDYPTAAIEMLDSKWAKQVKTRAYTLARMMETGEDYNG